MLHRLKSLSRVSILRRTKQNEQNEQKEDNVVEENPVGSSEKLMKLSQAQEKLIAHVNERDELLKANHNHSFRTFVEEFLPNPEEEVVEVRFQN